MKGSDVSLVRRLLVAVFCLVLAACLSWKVDSSKLTIGMTEDQVVAAIGEPDRTYRTYTMGHEHEQWVYRTRRWDPTYLYFDDGVLTAWQE